MAVYNAQNNRYQRLQPEKKSNSKAVYIVVAIVAVLFFLAPCVEHIWDTVNYASYGEYYQLSTVHTPEMMCLGSELEGDETARFGKEYYLLSVRMKNSSAYDAYLHMDSFLMEVEGITYWPKPWNENAEGAFDDWNNREFVPAQREKNIILLYELPAGTTKAELKYQATEEKTEKIEISFVSGSPVLDSSPNV